MSSGRFLNYCSNESCETRIDHPINKIIDKQKKKEATDNDKVNVAEKKKTVVKKTVKKKTKK